MDIIENYSPLLLIATAFVFFILETTLPFRDHVESRAKHITRNIALTAFNAIVLTTLYVVILKAVSSFAHTQNLGFAKFFPSAWQWVVLFLLFDVVLYLWHRANHRLPFLWRFHRVHHSDRDLDFSSASRFHTGELFISILIKALFIIITGAAFMHIVIFDFLVTLFSQFAHSNLHLHGSWERATRALIVTPDMHRIHHSQIQRETDSNYSTMFSWWDHIFRSYRENDHQKEITIGLTQYATEQKTTLAKILTMPFKS